MTLIDTLKKMDTINPNEIYTTNENRRLLKISNSTMKRLLKKGLIKANKIGGQYRILGKELLRLVSPKVERKTVTVYQKLKKRVKNHIKPWQKKLSRQLNYSTKPSEDTNFK